MSRNNNATLAGVASVEHERKQRLKDTAPDSRGSNLKLLAPILERVDCSHHWIVRKKPAHIEEPLGDAQIKTHLDGGAARGACPIRRGESTTQLALLDLDAHKGESSWEDMADAAGRVVSELERCGIRPVPFRSSGGKGLHLYMLWQKPQDAYSVRSRLADALAAVGFKNGTGGVSTGEIEVFPKQDEVPPKGCGSMFVLPYAGKSCPLDALEFEPVKSFSWLLSAPVPTVPRPERAAPTATAAPLDEDKLRALLSDHDPDSSYEDWLRIGMALHHETNGEGFGLWDTWSQGSEKYPGADKLATHWNSFGHHPNPTTLASLRVEKAASADDFEVVEPGAAAESNPAGNLPEAHLKNTDQANAHRIRARFSEKLISVNGRFHYWTGTHWAYDEGEASRCAAALSGIVKGEAKRAQARADDLEKNIAPEILQAAIDNPRKHALNKSPEGAKLANVRSLVDTLKAWQRECEMRARQEAALCLLRRMLTRDPEKMDSDPWALNCLNGTVDLRSGELRPHDPKDWITKLAPVAYDADARAARFERFMLEIADGNATMAAFLKRWFGYCATACVREQKFVIHIGQGANGKGTLLDVVQSVLGDYAGVAAPGLLAGSTKGSERHPTEIAKLFGLRMVTAHESDDGAVLREGFIKQLTGGDRLTGRMMRKDFFDFEPTHKVQLLTNHKPEIKGQDFAIWRRVLLVPYPVQYGSADDITTGKATALRDSALPGTLAQERAGVLRWIVEGAAEWYRDGLNPPDYVIAAGAAYQSEQDRIGQFVSECCELDREHWAPISGDFGGVYTAYLSWCRESGYQALGKGKFLKELERSVPYFSKEARYLGKAGNGRRKVNGVSGLQLVGESAL